MGILLIGLFILIGFLKDIFRIILAFLALLLSALLAKPFSFLTFWLKKIDLIPLTLKSFATLIATTLLLFIVFLFAGSILISYREKRREGEGLPPISVWERAGGATLGGLWSLFLIVLILTGIEIIGNVEEAFAEFSSKTREVQKTDDFFKRDWFQLKKAEKVKQEFFPFIKRKGSRFSIRLFSSEDKSC